MLVAHHKSLLVLKLCLANNFVLFSGKLNQEQKSYMLSIMDRFYLSNKVAPPVKFKRGKNSPEATLEQKALEFSQTNNLEIKMCVVRNMHRYLGPPIDIKLRKKFAAHYTHIESESKDNWRIRFSILTSLLGSANRRNPGSF